MVVANAATTVATAVVALAAVVMAAAVVPAKGSKRSKSSKCSCKNNDNKKVAILTMKLLNTKSYNGRQQNKTIKITF